MHRQQINEALDTLEPMPKELDRNTMPLEISELEEGSRQSRPRDEACISFKEELWASLDYIFQSKLTWLLVGGPIAIVGDALGLLGEPICFALSGIALIPCAER